MNEKNKMLFAKITLICFFVIFFMFGYSAGYISGKESVIIPDCRMTNSLTYPDYSLEFETLSQQIALKKTDCKPEIYLEGCESEFSKIAYNVANERSYVVDEYDCTEMANSLADKYNWLGWDAETKFVRIDCDNWKFSNKYTKEDCLDNNGGHLIVKVEEIYVEATSGDIIKPEDYKLYGLD